MRATADHAMIRQLTQKLITSILDEVDKEDVRKSMMEKLVAPTLRLIYTQLMPYLLIIVSLILIMLLLLVLTFCMMVVLYFTHRRK